MFHKDLHLLSGRVLFRTTMDYLLLFLILFLYSFFVDLCSLDSLLRVLWDPGDNSRTEPLHYVAELHPSYYSYDHCFSNLTAVYYHLTIQAMAYCYRSVASCIQASGCFKFFCNIAVWTCPSLWYIWAIQPAHPADTYPIDQQWPQLTRLSEYSLRISPPY